MSADDSSGHHRVIADYANYFEVGHNAFEFLIDFGQVDPQSGDVNINSRIAVGPNHAKLFLVLLTKAMTQFESEFGIIPELRDDDQLNAILDLTPELERRAIDVRNRPVSVPGKQGIARTLSGKSSQTKAVRK